MRDEDKSKEQLIEELAELRKFVADLERKDAEFKGIEKELLGKNHECQMLTSELEGKYRTIQWHESMLKQSLAELSEKNAACYEYNRQLRRKKITIRVLAVLFAIVLVILGLAASLGKVGQFARDFYKYEDTSYRPMDLERTGKMHPTEAGKGPARDRGKDGLPPGK